MDNVDFIPVLDAGKHRNPSEGACVMELVSLLAGEEWSDFPQCTDEFIAVLAQIVNDELSDKDRHLILSQFDRLFNTYIKDSDQDKWIEALAKKFNVRNADYASVRSQIYGTARHLIRMDGSPQQLVDVLKDVLDVYDEVFGRTTVEKKDLTLLQTLETSNAG